MVDRLVPGEAKGKQHSDEPVTKKSRVHLCLCSRQHSLTLLFDFAVLPILKRLSSIRPKSSGIKATDIIPCQGSELCSKKNCSTATEGQSWWPPDSQINVIGHKNLSQDP